MQTFFTYLTISNVVSTVLGLAAALLLITVIGTVGDMVDRYQRRRQVKRLLDNLESFKGDIEKKLMGLEKSR